jgi:hypothetical protein
VRVILTNPRYAGPTGLEPATARRGPPWSAANRQRRDSRQIRMPDPADDQREATTRVTDLETAWDDDQVTLKLLDSTAWDYLDGRIDAVLTALRARNPNRATE